MHRTDVVAISALTGEGMDLLVDRVGKLVTAGHRLFRISVEATDGAGAAWLHAHGDVVNQTADELETVYEVRLSPADYRRFMRRND